MHILHIALGGCLKAPPVAFGLTEDTGGHIAYVLGAAAAQAERADVSLVEIATRLFEDPALGSAYSVPVEQISRKCRIRRIGTADRRYLAKDALSREVGAFTGALIAEMEADDRLPDLVHAHFADAARVAMELRDRFGIPFLFSAHSLGLDKPCPAGRKPEDSNQRIAEEAVAIGAADGIIASSRDEAERQLLSYASARRGRILPIAPGIDSPPTRGRTRRIKEAKSLIAPFLRDIKRPIVLAIARPVHRKNLDGLIDIFGTLPGLRERANLVILAGRRDGSTTVPPEQRAVFASIWDRIDAHDLHGHVAVPKRHDRDTAFGLFELAARSGGVFANPAFNEPYGLTLAEAAALGLPVVATTRGGARDIVYDLGCGLSVEPEDQATFGAAILHLLEDGKHRTAFSRTGIARAGQRNWQAWAAPVTALGRRLKAQRQRQSAETLLVCDLDDTLTGDRAAAKRFAEWLATKPDLAFAIATGRSLEAALRILDKWQLPRPAFLVSGVGSEIFHRIGDNSYAPDDGYAAWIGADWDAAQVDVALDGCPGLVRQEEAEQRAFKRSWYADVNGAAAAQRRLADKGLHVRLIHSHGRLLDVLPARAGKGAAMCWLADIVGVDRSDCIAAGNSGNDADLLMAVGSAILVGNHDLDLDRLRHAAHARVSAMNFADGVLEGLGVLRVQERAA